MLGEVSIRQVISDFLEKVSNGVDRILICSAPKCLYLFLSGLQQGVGVWVPAHRLRFCGVVGVSSLVAQVGDVEVDPIALVCVYPAEGQCKRAVLSMNMIKRIGTSHFATHIILIIILSFYSLQLLPLFGP